MKKEKPILLATLGFPGSGKTFFARRFAKEYHIFHLNSDRVRLEIFPKPKYNQKENDAVFRAMDFIAEELLSLGVSVLYDANSTKRAYRRRFQQTAKHYKADFLLLWFQTSVDDALRRVEKRKKLKSEFLKKYHLPLRQSVFFRLRNAIEEPQKEPFVTIDGMQSYKEQKNTVLKALHTRYKIHGIK